MKDHERFCIRSAFQHSVRFADQSLQRELCDLCGSKNQLCVLRVPFVIVEIYEETDFTNALTAGDA